MTGFNKVYLDTAPLIYFLDDIPVYGKTVERILTDLLTSNKSIVTSVITCAEYLVYPYRTDNQKKIDTFWNFLKNCNIPLYKVNVAVAEKAAEIRAEYRYFKAIDSLQLSLAISHNCDLFLTNDKQLCQYKGLRCLTVDEYII